MRTVLHALPDFSAGTTRTLRSLHFGSRGAAGRKAYLQASLHADEVPAMLVAQHLRRQLEALEAAGQLRGEIVLVPMANPIGLAQDLQGASLGRFDLSTGLNFNRHYKSLTAALIPLLEPRLGRDVASNTALIRGTAMQLLQAWQPATETEALKQRLQCLAMDADIVLDLHCDNQAVLHLYTGTPLAAQAAPLARYLGAQALLTCTASGDDPFDETVARIWWELGAHFAGRFPIAQACFAATVELRGEVEVEHGLATAAPRPCRHRSVRPRRWRASSPSPRPTAACWCSSKRRVMRCRLASRSPSCWTLSPIRPRRCWPVSPAPCSPAWPDAMPHAACAWPRSPASRPIAAASCSRSETPS